MRQRIADAVPGIEGVEAVANSVAGRMEETSRLTADHAAALDGAMARSQTRPGRPEDASGSAGRRHRDGERQHRQPCRQAGPQMVEALVRVRETADAAASKARDAIRT